MSAFVCTTQHFLTVAAAGANHGGISWLSPSGHARRCRKFHSDEIAAVANILIAENVRSVNFRYSESDEPWTVTADDVDRRLPSLATDPVAALKLVHCLQYQSCESPDWESTEARAILSRIESALVRAMPGYGAAPWTVDEPTHEVTIVRLF